jgi:hypothetical protein
MMLRLRRLRRNPKLRHPPSNPAREIPRTDRKIWKLPWRRKPFRLRKNRLRRRTIALRRKIARVRGSSL